MRSACVGPVGARSVRLVSRAARAAFGRRRRRAGSPRRPAGDRARAGGPAETFAEQREPDHDGPDAQDDRDLGTLRSHGSLRSYVRRPGADLLFPVSRGGGVFPGRASDPSWHPLASCDRVAMFLLRRPREGSSRSPRSSRCSTCSGTSRCLLVFFVQVRAIARVGRAQPSRPGRGSVGKSRSSRWCAALGDRPRPRRMARYREDNPHGGHSAGGFPSGSPS